MNKRLIVLISWTAVFLWMVLIFYLSSQVVAQSDRLSKGITNASIGAIEKVAPGLDLDIKQSNHLVRKNTHFFAYLVLSILLDHNSSDSLRNCAGAVPSHNVKEF